MKTTRIRWKDSLALGAIVALVSGCCVSKPYVAAEARGAHEAASVSLSTIRDLSQEQLDKCLAGDEGTCTRIKLVLGEVENKLEEVQGHAEALCLQAKAPCSGDEAKEGDQ